METETQKKHSQKLKLIKVLKQIRNTLKRSLNLIILNAVFHQLDIFIVIANHHQTKLTNLRKKQDQ